MKDFYNVSFNAETGEYDGVLNFGEEVGMIGLDAAFTEIKAGESFDLRVDGLTIADRDRRRFYKWNRFCAGQSGRVKSAGK